MALTAPTWVGEVDRAAVGDLAVDPSFVAARLLVTAGGGVVGLVTVPLAGGRAGAAEVRRVLDDELGAVPDPAPPPSATDPLTVVVATRGRAGSLERCVRRVLAGDHPDVTLLVVDNDPVDDATERAVARIGDRRVRYLREARRGASVGRNRGLFEAPTPLVAFLDDDTEPDTAWARRVAGAFAARPELACVSGPVFGARLTTPEECAAEDALVWNKGFAPHRWSLAEPPADSAIFPFSPGLFGIGANTAVRAAAARAVGGFDEALGPGTAARAGEDIELFVRLVLAGHEIGYEPSAWVWHHHRPSAAALRAQVDGYAIGLGAFLGKIALDRGARGAALRRLPAAVARLRQINELQAGTDAAGSGASPRDRLLGLARGPVAYVRARRGVRAAGGRAAALTEHRRHDR